mgnify:CR=1 FL=1
MILKTLLLGAQLHQVLADQIAREFGQPFYRRIDQPATPEQKTALGQLRPEAVSARHRELNEVNRKALRKGHAAAG